MPSTPKCSTPTSNLSAPSYKEKTGAALPTSRTEGEILSNSNLKAFAFNDLRNATRNFRPDSLIGEGGFGYVYKGWLNEQNFAPSKPGSGMVVAVKKLKPEGFQGHKEWLVGQVSFSLYAMHSSVLNLFLVIDCRQRSTIWVNFIIQT